MEPTLKDRASLASMAYDCYKDISKAPECSAFLDALQQLTIVTSDDLAAGRMRSAAEVGEVEVF